MKGTFACELEPGDRILSGQTFVSVTVDGLSMDRVEGATLQCDVTVDRVMPDPMDGGRVIVTTREHAHLGMSRARVVRTS